MGVTRFVAEILLSAASTAVATWKPCLAVCYQPAVWTLPAAVSKAGGGTAAVPTVAYKLNAILLITQYSRWNSST